MNKEFANVYNLTSKKVGVISLFLVILYEIMWSPVDNYDSRLISNLLTFPELIIDVVTCTLQTCLCKTAIRYEARNGLLLKWENKTFPMFITILALFCTLLALPMTLLQIQLYHSFSIQQWDWQNYYVDVMILSLLSCLLFTISLLVQYIGYAKCIAVSFRKCNQTQLNNTPLHITITNNNNNLVVTNDYRPIDNGRLSLGIGRQNISERYNVLGISGVKFYHKELENIVEIPLV